MPAMLITGTTPPMTTELNQPALSNSLVTEGRIRGRRIHRPSVICLIAATRPDGL